MNLASILNQLLTGIVIVDEGWIVRYVNAAAESIFDHSAKRLIGEPFAEAYYESDLPLNTLQNCLSEEQTVVNSEASFFLHSGQRVTTEVSIQSLHDDGQKQWLIELKQVDLQRQISRETQQQQQLFATQSLLRGMAHEIKNPLGGLRGAAQLLALELPDESLREYTDLIVTQADRLRTLIDRMMGPVQAEHKRETNLHELLERVAKTLRYEYGDSLEIKRDYDPSLPELWAMAESCEQVFLNIAQNAAQALEGTGRITFKTRIEHQLTLLGRRHRQCAVISIIDDGPGIDDAIMASLFYPMVSGRAEGTGLGLSMAHSLVHQHQGKIEVDSEPGHTVFRIYLPYQQQPSEEASL